MGDRGALPLAGRRVPRRHACFWSDSGPSRRTTWYLAIDQFGYLTFAEDLAHGARRRHDWELLPALRPLLPAKRRDRRLRADLRASRRRAVLPVLARLPAAPRRGAARFRPVRRALREPAGAAAAAALHVPGRASGPGLGLARSGRGAAGRAAAQLRPALVDVAAAGRAGPPDGARSGCCSCFPADSGCARPGGSSPPGCCSATR